MGIVKYLLDTHTLLWAAHDESKISKKTLTIMEDINAPFFVSAISAYEIMYKHRLGKLPGYAYVAENYFNILDELDVNELPITTRHAHLAGKLEWAHRDPFDRMLAAQAFIENLTLITNDEAFNSLPWVNTLW
jgi:PIN domain nuclease of toxin-antitoxin system